MVTDHKNVLSERDRAPTTRLGKRFEAKLTIQLATIEAEESLQARRYLVESDE